MKRRARKWGGWDSEFTVWRRREGWGALWGKKKSFITREYQKHLSFFSHCQVPDYSSFPFLSCSWWVFYAGAVNCLLVYYKQQICSRGVNVEVLAAVRDRSFTHYGRCFTKMETHTMPVSNLNCRSLTDKYCRTRGICTALTTVNQKVLFFRVYRRIDRNWWIPWSKQM